MLRKLIWPLIILSILLSLFLNKSYTYYGEDDHWTADLKVKQSYYGFETQELVLTYIGEDVNTVGDIQYFLESIYSFGWGNVYLEENGTISKSVENMTVSGRITEDTEIRLTVEWDGQTETFILDKQ